MIGFRAYGIAGGRALAATAVLVFAGCSAGEEGAPAASDITVVWGGGLFDGNGDAVVPNPGIVVAEGRFTAVDAVAASEASVAVGAAVVEVGDGEVILPGLFDLHAHFHLDLFGEGASTRRGLPGALPGQRSHQHLPERGGQPTQDARPAGAPALG